MFSDMLIVNRSSSSQWFEVPKTAEARHCEHLQPAHNDLVLSCKSYHDDGSAAEVMTSRVLDELIEL
jgi:hypothetical protein